MPSKSPGLYNLRKTTIFFSIASIVLLAGLVAMVVQDSTREWKRWQRKFVEYKRERAEEALVKAEKAINKKELAQLQVQLDEAKRAIDGKKSQIAEVEAELAKLDVARTKANSLYQNLKQEQDSFRYFFEEHRLHHHDDKAEVYGKKLADIEPKVKQAKLDFEAVDAQIEELNAKLQAFGAEQKKFEKEIASVTKEVTGLEKSIEKLTPGWREAILNAPMLDFIRPTLQIQQIVVEDLYDDFYFNKTNKVDRCVTCHLGIDQKSMEDAPAPFKAHPRLDLFVSADSPHPMEEFGCTVCHAGSGHSVSFVTAAHTPQDEKQAKEWKKKYHWHPMKHWREKMLPLKHTEASCTKCHSGAVEVPKAPVLNEGRRLAQTFGCFNCHKVEGFERWKVGPSLLNVQSKLEQDWIVRWLENPREFRPSTKMPRVFHLSNNDDPESKEIEDTVISGIATYLVKNSEPISLKSPKKGNPEVGERLVKELGCLGCHTSGEAKAANHGPELSGLGSKVTADWLYTWLKNPTHYSKETRMPDMRLTDEEASDITSYLLTLKSEKFEGMALPHVKSEVVDDIALQFLSSSMRQEEAKQKISEMKLEEKLEFVGKKSIAQKGCFGCHSIKGFEDAKPIGAELTHVGTKDIHKFDFGFIHDIGHTHQDWFKQKLKEPRSFDEGKEKAYLDRLRMPQFDFTDQQAEHLTTFLLSLQKHIIPMSMQKNLDLKEQHIEAGRLLVSKLNCQGCHTLDGKTGEVRSLFDDLGNAPPEIYGQGKKVQPQWLYHFLKDPTPIRPWLKYRMPTFNFTEEELNILVQYFHSLDDLEPRFRGEAIENPATPEEIAAGRELFKQFQCIKCHKSDPEPGLSASFLAPDLVPSKERLRPDWVIDWMWDPAELQPGTMMPNFFPDGESPVTDILDGDAAKQIKAIRDYLWTLEADEAKALARPQAATQG